MSIEQVIIIYLTGLIVTMCYFGATGRLPGQHEFRTRTQATAAQSLVRDLEKELQDVSEASALRLAVSIEALVIIPALLMLWPLYWIGLSALTLHLSRTPKES